MVSTLAEAVKKTIEWSKVFVNNGDLKEITSHQILEYMEE